MKNAFDFDFFCIFPSFWWSGGGYGSATVTGRYFFFFLVKRPQWLSESLWWVNCFCFFVAVVCFVFFKDRSWTFTRNFFFSHSSFSFDHRFRFCEALELIDMHNNDGFLELAREHGRGSTGEACHAHFSWSSCCSKDETRGAFLFLNPRLYIYFCLIWFWFSRTF